MNVQTKIKPQLLAHAYAVFILIAFSCLGIIYSLVTPPFEAGDESRHYAVVKYMADTGQLPIQQHGEAQIHWSHEGNQPPLYYAMAAALTFWIDTGRWNDVFWYNPHATIGVPLRPDNKNITIHQADETFPWHGHGLAVHLIRFFSLALATVTVATSYFIALSLFKGQRHLATAAMAVTAFNPMFIFISASVNNDNLVIALVTLALLVMIKLVKERQKAELTLILIGVLGILIGLGALTKLYALGLLPLAMGLVARLGTNKKTGYQWKITALRLFILITPIAQISDWFYFRNAMLYDGDWLGLQSMRQTAGMRHEPFSFTTLRAEFEGLRIAYWALFGGVNILVTPWIYTLLDALSLLATIGLFRFLILDFGFWIISILDFRFWILDFGSQSKIQNPKSKIHMPTLLILLSWSLIMVAGFIVWNLTQPATQGRLFYPAISAISALGVLGLTWWLPRRGQTIMVMAVSAGLFLFASLCPFLYIAPAYAKSPRLTVADLPPDLHHLDFTYDGTMHLIGYQLPIDTIRPAETMPLTLYWQLLKPTPLDYSIFVHLLGKRREVVGQIDTYPDGGRWPTRLLSVGDILADHYEITIRPESEFNAPTQLLITAGIYDFHEAGRPGRPSVNAQGKPIEPIVARLKLVPWQWPRPTPMPNPINFDHKISLLNYEMTGQAITFTWQANQPMNTDITVFIQAWAKGQPNALKGFDSPPVQGDYPTSLWSPGEIIIDVHPLDLSTLPVGDYYFLVGLYRLDTGERLPAFKENQPLKDYALNVGIKN